MGSHGGTAPLLPQALPERGGPGKPGAGRQVGAVSLWKAPPPPPQHRRGAFLLPPISKLSVVTEPGLQMTRWHTPHSVHRMAEGGAALGAAGVGDRATLLCQLWRLPHPRPQTWLAARPPFLTPQTRKDPPAPSGIWTRFSPFALSPGPPACAPLGEERRPSEGQRAWEGSWAATAVQDPTLARMCFWDPRQGHPASASALLDTGEAQTNHLSTR